MEEDINAYNIMLNTKNLTKDSVTNIVNFLEENTSSYSLLKNELLLAFNINEKHFSKYLSYYNSYSNNTNNILSFNIFCTKDVYLLFKILFQEYINE